MITTPPIDPPVGPLSEAVFCILLSLATEPRHGYGIMQDVQALSHGRVSLSAGTLYGALKRLLDQAWIERFTETTEISEPSGRESKYYQLTPQGWQIFRAEVARIEELAQLARRRMQTAGGSEC